MGESVGIRLNCRKPNIYFKQQKAGGIKFTSTVALTRMDEKLVHNILHEYKIFNAEVLFREDCNADQLIDVIEGSRKYLPFSTSTTKSTRSHWRRWTGWHE